MTFNNEGGLVIKSTTCVSNRSIWKLVMWAVQSDGAVEYNDCISADEYVPQPVALSSGAVKYTNYFSTEA